jgi:hypothetical protein
MSTNGYVCRLVRELMATHRALDEKQGKQPTSTENEERQWRGE